jgi:hypothetical protein
VGVLGLGVSAGDLAGIAHRVDASNRGRASPRSCQMARW